MKDTNSGRPSMGRHTDTTEERVPLVPRPFADQILVRQDPPIKKIGSGLLVAPEGSEKWPPTATIVAVGPGIARADGMRVAMDPDLVPGTRVVIRRRAATALVPDGRAAHLSPPEFKDLIMLREDDILMVIDVPYGTDLVADDGTTMSGELELGAQRDR